MVMPIPSWPERLRSPPARYRACSSASSASPWKYSGQKVSGTSPGMKRFSRNPSGSPAMAAMSEMFTARLLYPTSRGEK